jgi:hypothetical protein
MSFYIGQDNKNDHGADVSIVYVTWRGVSECLRGKLQKPGF